MRPWFLPSPLEGKGRREGAVVQVVGTLRCSLGVFTPPSPSRGEGTFGLVFAFEIAAAGHLIDALPCA